MADDGDGTLVLVQNIEGLDLTIDPKEQIDIRKQKEGFQQIAVLCAGTVEYEHDVQKVMTFLPTKDFLKSFTEKEKARFPDDKEKVEDLDRQLQLKLDSHDKIIDQVSNQVQSAKRFRKTVLDTFERLQASSVICRSAWGSLIGLNLSDQIVKVVQDGDMNDLKEQLKSLETLKNDLNVLNQKAIDVISENLKKVIDGGSEDIKKAMADYNQLEEALQKIQTSKDKTRIDHHKKMDDYRFKIEQADQNKSQLKFRLENYKKSALGSKEKCQQLIEAQKKEKADMELEQKKMFDEQEKEFNDASQKSLAEAEKNWSILKNQSIEQQEQFHQDEIARINKRNAERDEQKKQSKEEIEKEIEIYKEQKLNPKLPQKVDYTKQEEMVKEQIKKAQEMMTKEDEYTWFKVKHHGWFGIYTGSSDQKKLTQSHAITRKAGQELYDKAQKTQQEIDQKKIAEQNSLDDIKINNNKYYDEQLAALRERQDRLDQLFEHEEIPQPFDAMEQKQVIFKETEQYQILIKQWNRQKEEETNGLKQNISRQVSSMNTRHSNEASNLTQNIIIFVRNLGLVVELQDNQSIMLPILEGQLDLVLKDESLKQKEAYDDLNKIDKAQKDANIDMKTEDDSYKTFEAKTSKDVTELNEKLQAAYSKLQTYKDSSPVPLENLVQIYSKMNLVRSRQENVNNLQEILPTTIEQFKQECTQMVKSIDQLHGIKLVEYKADQQEVTQKVGKLFNSQKQEMIQSWVKELADDEETQPLCEALISKSKLFSLKKFKESCSNDGKRAEFITKVQKLDDDQKDQLQDLMEALTDNIQDWETIQSDQICLKLKCSLRYQYTRNAFNGIVKQIRFQPNTQQLCSAITEAISKVDGKAGQEMQSLSFPTSPPIEHDEKSLQEIDLGDQDQNYDYDPSHTEQIE